MAKCKYCHENISRLDKEICPFCGGKKPLDGEDTSTKDVTKLLGEVIDPNRIHHHSKILTGILCILFGFLGVHAFYIKKPKRGVIILIISLAVIGGIGSLLTFLVMHNVFGFLIPYFVIELLMIITGINYLVRFDLTDGDGEFLE